MRGQFEDLVTRKADLILILNRARRENNNLEELKAQEALKQLNEKLNDLLRLIRNKTSRQS